jgi:ABC-type antimicrobial peptide transport system permease subunit
MYRYIFDLVIRRIERNIKVYLLILIEILLCVFLLNSSLTLYDSINKEYLNRRNRVDSTYFNIGITNLIKEKDLGKSNSIIYQASPFSMEDLEYILKSFPDIGASLYILTSNNINDFTSIKSINLIYASEGFFRQQLHINKPIKWENTCFIGSRVGEFYNEGIKKLSLADVIDEKTIDLPVQASTLEVDLKDTVIIPIRYYYDNNLFEHVHAFNSTLSIDFGSDGYSSHVIAKILTRLFSKHPEYTYLYSNSLEQYMKQTNELKMICTAIFYLCVFFVLIIIIGLSGKSLMLINKRKKEFAVLSAFGAPKKMLRFETYAEIFLVSFISGTVGLIISLILLLSIKFEYFTVVFNVGICLIALFSALLITFISSLLPIRVLSKMSPIEILRKDQ